MRGVANLDAALKWSSDTALATEAAVVTIAAVTGEAHAIVEIIGGFSADPAAVETVTIANGTDALNVVFPVLKGGAFQWKPACPVQFPAGTTVTVTLSAEATATSWLTVFYK